MLKDHGLIVVSDDWGRHPFSCQHIVERLLPFNRVLWVNTVGYRPLRLTSYDARRALGKVCSWIRPQNPREFNSSRPSNIRVLDPVFLPFGTYSAIRAFNARSVSRSVRNASLSWNFQHPLLITTLPTAADFVGRLGEIRAVYYCVDDYNLWPGEDGALMRELEERLLRRVDLVVATSGKLQRTRSNGRRSTVLLTHGVDLQHFKAVGTVPPATDIKNLVHPVVGYYGLVDERCDLQLIASLACSLPHITFLVIGPWKVPQAPLAGLSNVNIVGKVDYAQLPAYLAPVDLLILPYHINQLAEAINPLKLKEYLATGLPVVSTPLPEVVKLHTFLKVAYNASEFRQAVIAGLGQGKRYSVELEHFLQGETWEAKAEVLSNMVQELLTDAVY
jgi:glycosyltransferase involved in cell wall biosynthesis